MNFMLDRLRNVWIKITFSVISEAPARTQYGNADHPNSDEHQHGRAEPKKECILPHGRFHEDKGAIAGHQEGLDIIVGLTALDLLANQAPQIGGQSGVGFIDRLPLADQAAELFLERLGAGFQNGISKGGHKGASLVCARRPDGSALALREGNRKSVVRAFKRASPKWALRKNEPHSAGSATVPAAMRAVRSLAASLAPRAMNPANAMTTAPSQMNGAMGLT